MADINEIISKEALAGLEKGQGITQAWVNDLYKIIEASSKLNSAYTEINKSTGAAAEKAAKLTEAQKEANKITKEQEKSAKALAAAALKQTKIEEDYAKAISKEAKTISETNKQTKALIYTRNNLDKTSKDYDKTVAGLNKRINENNNFVKANSSALEKQKMNVGNYANSIRQALGAMGPFGQTINNITNTFNTFKEAVLASSAAQKTAAVATGIATKAMNILKIAIISTGIGALVVLLGSLYTYFTRTGEGADKLARFMAQVRAVVDVLLDRFAVFGEGLMDIFSGRFSEGAQKIKASFVGIGKELKDEVKTAGELADELDKLDEDRRKNQEIIAKNNIRITQLEEIARDAELKDLEKKKSAIDEIMGLARQNASLSKSMAQAEIDNINKQASMRTLNDEELQKLSDARIALMNEEAAGQSQINSFLKLRSNIYKEVEEAALKAYRAENPITKLEAEPLDLEKQLEKDLTDIHRVGLEMREQDDIDFAAREEERRKENRKKWREDEENAAEYKKEIALATAEAVQEIGNMLFEFSMEKINTELQQIEKSKQYELSLVGDNAAQKSAIEKKYAKEEKDLRIKAAKQNKAAALFNAIIGTAMATINGFMTMPFFPVGLAMGILAGVLGTLQIGLIAAQPLPSFAKGTKSAPKGLALIGERGRELIMGPDGSMAMSPSQATLVNMGRGGQRIIPNRETEMLLRMARGADDGTSRAMMLQMREDNRALIDTIKNKSELHIYGSGRRITERKGNYYKTYYNKKILG